MAGTGVLSPGMSKTWRACFLELFICKYPDKSPRIQSENLPEQAYICSQVLSDVGLISQSFALIKQGWWHSALIPPGLGVQGRGEGGWGHLSMNNCKCLPSEFRFYWGEPPHQHILQSVRFQSQMITLILLVKHLSLKRSLHGPVLLCMCLKPPHLHGFPAAHGFQRHAVRHASLNCLYCVCPYPAMDWYPIQVQDPSKVWTHIPIQRLINILE